MQFANTRLAMAWLHTWLGLIFGFVLMTCFFFGTLSVFDREIDRWAIPETRFDPQPMPSFDKVLLPVFQRIEPDVDEYNSMMPGFHDPAAGPQTPRLELPPDEYMAYTTHRDPVLRMGVGFSVPHPKVPNDHNHIHGETTIDPRSGEAVSDRHLKIGSEWFYPMHYSLNFEWNFVGYYIVGLAAFFMLVALVSGVWIHRKIFREFFTLRTDKSQRRNILDLHNLSGVVALPFHFFFALTALIIFAQFFYLPVANTQLKPLHDLHEKREAEKTGLPHERAGVPAALASVDAMVAEAKRRWAERGAPGEVGFLVIYHVGDANSYVSLFRAGSDRVALVGEGIHFKASTGEVLYEDPPHGVAESAAEFLTGLHLQHFEHWFLRWLYVVGGLLGSISIATGFLFFIEKRKQHPAHVHTSGSRWIEALSVTTVTGMIIAAVAMLLANRLLPPELPDKGDWEKAIFFGAWITALLHAFWCSARINTESLYRAWRQQCVAIAMLACAAVVSNWVTTGDHLVKTLITDRYLAVAGVDVSLLVTGLVAGVVAFRLASSARRNPVVNPPGVVYE